MSRVHFDPMAASPRSPAFSPQPRVPDQGLMLTLHDAMQVVDQLEGVIPSLPASRKLAHNLWALGNNVLTLELAHQQIQNAKLRGAARWPDPAVRLLLLECRLLLAENQVAEAADRLWQTWQRPYLVRSADLIGRQVVAAATICLTAGDQAGARRWLEWGAAYLRVRDAGGWFRIVDWLVEFLPAHLDMVASPWRPWYSLNVHLRRFARWLETASRGPVARRINSRAAIGVDALALLAYRLRPGVGVDGVRWDGPLAPPLDTLAAIKAGLHTPDQQPHRPAAPNGRPRKPAQRRAGVLVTRAMGGLGDLLMMTPALRALAQQRGERLDLAIQSRYFPLFETNPDVRTIDIENAPIDLSRYTSWINLSDCPAARVESSTAPRVRHNRIDIFAGAMGLRRSALKTMDRRPRYPLDDHDRDLKRQFWKAHDLDGQVVVGVQLKAQEAYKDHAAMHLIITTLAERYRVLVFHAGRGQPEFDVRHPQVTCVFNRPLREAFALAAGCQAIVAPDSAFVHLAAALDVPCVALFGPTDGKVFTRYYPNVVYLDCRDHLGCIPCWRNEYTVCHLSQGRNSVCMSVLPVPQIVAAVDSQVGPQSGSRGAGLAAADASDPAARRAGQPDRLGKMA